MKTARFLLHAEVEMLDAAVYYQAQAAGLGDTFLEKVDSGVRDIAEHPLAWPIVQGDVRKRPVHRFPYSVLYRADPDGVVGFLPLCISGGVPVTGWSVSPSRKIRNDFGAQNLRRLRRAERNKGVANDVSRKISCGFFRVGNRVRSG